MTAPDLRQSGIVGLLFTDIVDSTALYDRLGDEQAESVRRSHFRELREAIVVSGGREVKNLGDGLMVVFQSAVEAVQCAVRIQQRMAGPVAGGAHRVQARVGLHVGEPIREDDDYFGTAVITARRLCDRAAAGEILASDVVVGLLRGRAGAQFVEVGPLALKGLSEPVVAYRVVVELLSGTAPSALPPPLQMRLRSPFAGRTEAVDSLLDAWKEAVAGERRIVMLGGEPGIGKTRLAAHIAGTAHAAGATVLFGRCDADALRSYQPFAEALRHHLLPLPAEHRAQVLAAAPELADLVPELAEAPADSSPRETDRARLFDAVTSVIGTIAETTPVLLVLDDLHWADEPTLLLLRYLLRSSEQWPLLVVGTYRDTELGRTHPLAAALAELRRDAAADRLRLGGLVESEVLGLLAPAGAEETAATLELAEALVRETEGNPFFLHEMVRHLLESGRLRDEDGTLVATGPIDHLELPEGIREVIGQRLSRLSSEANDLLSIAAVLGLEFAVSPLAAISGAPVDSVLAALDEAVAARIVEEVAGSVDRFGFAHALIRSTLYDELTSARRLRLHWRAAEVLGAAGAEPSEVAAHAVEGAPLGDLDLAIICVLEAARQATERTAAYEETVQLCQRGLQLLPAGGRDDLRALLLTTQGEAIMQLGDFEPGVRLVIEACAAAQRAGDPELLANAAVVAARSALGSPVEGVEEWTRAALAALPPGDSPARARLEGVLARIDPDPEAAVRALELARRIGDPEALVYASLSRVNRLRSEPTGQQRFDLLEEARVAVGDPDSLPALVCELNQIEALLEMGDRDRAASLCVHTAQVIDALRLPWPDEVLLPRAGAAFLDARFDEAASIATEVMSTATLESVQGYAGGMLLAAMRELDQGASLIPFIEARSQEAPEWRSILGYLEVENGQPDEGRRHLAGIVEDLRGNVFLGLGLFVAGEAAANLGDATLAESVEAALAEWSGACIPVGGYFTLGAVDRVLGRLALVLGRTDEARSRLEVALAVHTHLRAPHLVAQTQLDLAEVHEAEGDPTAAAALRAEVATTARDGMPRLARLATRS